MSDSSVRVVFDLVDKMGAPLDKIQRSTDAVENKIKGISNASGDCSEKVDKAGLSVGKLLTGFAAYQAVSMGARAVIDFGKGSIEAAGQIEKFTVTLENMLGSKKAADARILEYMDIAKKTPFELTQVVAAGNQLQALGKYSRDNVSMLGDLAAASGKPMEQALSAYAKMATGQKGIAVDMFRDLLVTSKDWQDATGKGISKNGELLATTEELISAIPKIMSKKGFAGMMATQAKTIEGQVSNMKDAFFGLQAAVGERMKPAYSSFVTGATSAIDKVKKWVEIPLEQKLKEEQLQVNILTQRLMDGHQPQEERLRLYNELKKIAPEIVDNITKEDVAAGNLSETHAKLVKNLNDYNKSMLVRIGMETNRAQLEKVMKPLGTTQADVTVREQSLMRTVTDSKLGIEKEFEGKDIEKLKKTGTDQQKKKIVWLEKIQGVLNGDGSDEEKLNQIFKGQSGVYTQYNAGVAAYSDLQTTRNNLSTSQAAKQREIDVLNESIKSGEDTLDKINGKKKNNEASSITEDDTGTNSSSVLNDTTKSVDSTISNGGQRSITISIGKVGVDTLTLHSQNVTEGVGEIKDMLLDNMLRVVNSVAMQQ